MGVKDHGFFSQPKTRDTSHLKQSGSLGNALIVGCGHATWNDHLVSHEHDNIKTLDYDTDANPDFVADVTESIDRVELNGRFDIIFLENIDTRVFNTQHKIEKLLQNLNRWATQQGVIAISTGYIDMPIELLVNQAQQDNFSHIAVNGINIDQESSYVYNEIHGQGNTSFNVVMAVPGYQAQPNVDPLTANLANQPAPLIKALMAAGITSDQHKRLYNDIRLLHKKLNQGNTLSNGANHAGNQRRITLKYNDGTIIRKADGTPLTLSDMTSESAEDYPYQQPLTEAERDDIQNKLDTLQKLMDEEAQNLQNAQCDTASLKVILDDMESDPDFGEEKKPGLY